MSTPLAETRKARAGAKPRRKAIVVRRHAVENEPARRQPILANGERSRGYVAIAHEECDEHALSVAAKGLLILIRRYVSRMETDGLITDAALRGIFTEFRIRKGSELVKQLASIGTLSRRDLGWIDAQALTWDRSHAERESDRESARQRKAKSRMSQRDIPVPSANVTRPITNTNTNTNREEESEIGLRELIPVDRHEDVGGMSTEEYLAYRTKQAAEQDARSHR